MISGRPGNLQISRKFGKFCLKRLHKGELACTGTTERNQHVLDCFSRILPETGELGAGHVTNGARSGLQTDNTRVMLVRQ